jgi:hypothetical protein
MSIWAALRVLAVGCSVAVFAVAAAPAQGPQPTVTVIGDSIMTGVLWHADAMSILHQDLDLRMEVAVCRRLTGAGCTFEGVTPPNLLQVVKSSGSSLGPTVVVVMGYNDREETFASSVAASLAALHRAGVTRVLWATLREVRHPYVHMNDVVYAAAKSDPELTILDWNKYARSHPDWFQTDGMHLEPVGGAAMATFLHASIVSALAKPLPLLLAPSSLPPAQVGRHYAVRVVARNGVAPYRFKLVGGALPRGMKLRTDGWLLGTPLRPIHTHLHVRATDTRGRSVVRVEPFDVAR